MSTESVFATPEAAESAFYNAFAHADLPVMMSVWAADDAIACIHPLGTRVTGVAAVRRSWETIFRNDRKLHFRIADVQTMIQPELAIRIVHEYIRFPGDGDFQPPVIATNVYRLIDGSWRMVLHHASPTPKLQPSKRPAVVH